MNRMSKLKTIQTPKPVKWTHVLMVLLLASLMFGGTFTCKSDNAEVTGTTNE